MISLARDMKAALQEAEEAEEGELGDGKRLRDAKGREILSEEEKAIKEEKDKKKSAEVCLPTSFTFRLRLIGVESCCTRGEDTETCGQSRTEAEHIHRVGNRSQRPGRGVELENNMRVGGRGA